MTRIWIVVAALLVIPLVGANADGQMSDPRPATTSEAEKGIFVRQLLASREKCRSTYAGSRERSVIG